MEDVLDLYAKPLLDANPVVCFDESPYQLIAETRQPIPASPGKPAQIDYEYRRAGTCNLFLMVQPLTGWRHVSVTEQRTKQDFAHQMQALVDIHFPHSTQISVVLDNLNTHTPTSLYETFPPAEAKRILDKLDFRFTPKHGSWLNMAEIEFSILHKQCLDRRLDSMAVVQAEIAAWVAARNQAKATIQWQFTSAQARTKLDHLYPSLP